MTKACPNCKTENPDNSGFCQNCGTELEGTTNAVKSNVTSGEGVTGFWKKQGTGGKVGIGIGICCLGLILIIAIGGMFSSDKTGNNTTTPTTTTTTQTPTSATISQLYNNAISKGTTVQVTGTVIQSDGSNLRIKDANDQDIMVQGDNVNGYEGKSVTVVGTFDGPQSYDTAIGSSRTVPFLINAKVV
jgi:uncharacterized membrane protein YvbJ